MRLIKMNKLQEAVNNVDDEDFDSKFYGTSPVSYADAVKKMQQKKKNVEKDLEDSRDDVRELDYTEDSRYAHKVPRNNNLRKMHLSESLFEYIDDDNEPRTLPSDADDEDYIDDIEDYEQFLRDVGELNEAKTIPDPPSAGIESASATILNALIRDEWEAIQGYNDAIATFETENMNDDMLNVFKDIVNEEHVHIGQLQKVLEQVSPNTSSIANGEREAEEQVNEPVNVGDSAVDQGE